MNLLPLITSAHEVAGLIDHPDLLILDLRDEASYLAGHIPNAINFSLSEVVATQAPTGGLLPDEEQMSAALSRIGFEKNRHILAVDDNGGPQAARLIWTLEAFGIENCSFLNGGFADWVAEIGATDITVEQTYARTFQAQLTGNNVIYRDEIIKRLGTPDLQLLDARTLGEYQGTDVRSARGGHIPGAIHFDWSQIKAADMKLKPLEHIRIQLREAGFDENREIAAYCQTHMRSSVVCLVMKALGFKSVKGYPGAWSDWGNQTDTPIE